MILRLRAPGVTVAEGVNGIVGVHTAAVETITSFDGGPRPAALPGRGTWLVTTPSQVPRIEGGSGVYYVRVAAGRLITTFTLQLNANPPFLGFSFGRFTSANCNHAGLAGYYATSTGAPANSMESMACTDGDFGLVLETLSATMAEGPCSLGGPNRRFTMKKR